MLNALKNFKWGFVFVAFFDLIVAALLFLFGNSAIATLTIAIGITMELSAVVLLSLTIADKRRGFNFGIKIALSVCMLICGTVTLIARGATMSIILSLFGLLLIIDGSFKFHDSALAKRARSWIWWLMLALSTLTIAGGYYTVSFPYADTDAITFFIVAVTFVLDAAVNIMSIFTKRKIEKSTADKAQN